MAHDQQARVGLGRDRDRVERPLPHLIPANGFSGSDQARPAAQGPFDDDDQLRAVTALLSERSHISAQPIVPPGLTRWDPLHRAPSMTTTSSVQ